MGKNVRDFIACDKFHPTLLDGQRCYSLNKSSIEKGETQTGERNGIFLIIDPGNYIGPVTSAPKRSKRSDLEDNFASLDLQQSNEGSPSGRIYIDILSRYSNFKPGSYSLTGLKKMTGTESFISKIPEKVRNCQVESYVECRTQKYYEEWKNQCNCVPWSSSLTSSEKVRNETFECELTWQGFLQENYCEPSCVASTDDRRDKCLVSCTGWNRFVHFCVQIWGSHYIWCFL